MDEHISEFLFNNYREDNHAMKLLAWLVIDKNNTANRITARLKHAVENQKVITKPRFIRRVDKYHKFYNLNRPQPLNVLNSSKRIHSLQVCDFRGFGRLTDEDLGVKFKFNKLNNIFFAPNGGGKSSLCEVLEYQTTGDIKEAGRRKTSIKNYIRRNGKHIISLLDHTGKPIQANPDYKYNFIDRNRLQEFSLLGSNDTKFGERDVLAALVGLENFDDFLSMLVAPRSFNALSFIKNEHANKLESLESQLERLRISSSENNAELRSIKSEIIKSLGCDFKNLSERYIDNVVRIKLPHIKKYHLKLNEKKEQLKKGIPSVEIPLEHSRRILAILCNLLQKKKRIETKLNEIVYDANSIALFKLSKKILTEQKYSACPLCNTSLAEVNKDPLVNAIDILNSYVHVTNLQTCLNETLALIQKFTTIVSDALRAFLISPVNVNVDCDFKALADISNNISVSNDDVILGYMLSLDDILKSCGTLDLYNEKAKQHNVIIKNTEDALKKIISRINTAQELVSSIENNFSIYRSKKQDKGKKKNAFERLMNSIKVEKELFVEEVKYNNFLKGLNKEYEEFYKAAYDFKRTKELQILAGINNSIVHYYNEINKHDDDSEKLNDISFVYVESLKSYRLQLDINGVPADAFVRLSEGHLKSLGLAILLALAKKKQSQFIVFDDVVNAIDTEHRSNIINTFLTDPYIKRTQKIITTHDKLFWELYSNREKSLGNGEFSSFILECYPHGIHFEERDISFEGKISESLEHYDIRQALIYCRIWFESLATEHCVASELSLTASFTNRDYVKPNLLKVSLEKMYAVLIGSLGDRLENINEIKNNFLSWGIQNQEHHAFSENNYNIIHSKTSQEIQVIFDSIRKFKIQLSPTVSLVSLTDQLLSLNDKINAIENRIQSANPAVPVDVIRKWSNDKSRLVKEKEKVDELKVYCESCIPQV
ncbi:TPA: AAA family ATPase [Escherichia coli]|nr:AAA family ATPase [Escherichia coli]EIG2045428.1 AAA family ATPase [Escherichia coli]HBZ9578525.1 AAA family ATPase [Escherichia coli]HCA1429242.1 AAA family ATPase [Escherichia coli]HCA2676205.1 AAA family ATPase [Escherichia coli]